MKPTWIKNLAAGLAACSVAGAAFAQYVWIDEKGTKQFSDQPPPASVPQSKILKSPSKELPSLSPAKPAAAAAPAAPATGTAPMTTAERNADYNKRKLEQAEKDKKAAEEAKIAETKAQNCEKARAHQRTLQSGQRISATDEKGERYYLNEQQKAKELQQNQAVLAACK